MPKHLNMLNENWLKGIKADPVTASSSDGKELKGLRFQLHTTKPSSPNRIDATEWVFAPLEEIEGMIRYLQGRIVLSRTNPSTATKQ